MAPPGGLLVSIPPASTARTATVESGSVRVEDDGRPRVRDILVVEDESAVREMLSEALWEGGYSVDDVGDGEEAVASLRQGHYRLLLLDLLLPGLDGMGVLQALRAAPALRPAAILVLSGLRDRADIRRALEAGADDYLTKPFDLDDLELRVDLWLRRASPAKSLAPPGLRVHSLGRFHVEHGGQICLHADSRPRKAVTLVTYLMSQPGQAAPKAEVLALLWPGTPSDLQATSLRALHHRLRGALGLPAPLRVGPTQVTLLLGPGDWWDVVEFRAWLAEGDRWRLAGDTARALDAYAAGVGLYGGDYLVEVVEAPWAGALRAHLRGEWLGALGKVAHLHGLRGARGEQEAALRRLLQADPVREPEARALMEVLARQGRRGEALALYHTLDERLRTTLQVSPAPETQALAARIMTAGEGA